GLKYFTHHRTGPEMAWAESDKMPALGRLFSEEMSRKLGAARTPEEPLEQHHRNLAASLQARLEEVYFRMLTLKRLHTPLKAVGAAFYVWHQKLGKPRSFVMEHAYWGPGYSREAIRRAIDSNGLAQSGYSITELNEEELSRRAAAIVADGKILGWFQGRAEWG